ncbi:MAG TPA: hypothetical protein VFU38_01965 [Candidatus Krumholzibacteria bacterium]|nr:hypothetical protein [Candidatus Krumholzibacteria bacterium]
MILRAPAFALLMVLAAPAARAELSQPIDSARYPTAGIVAHREYRLMARAMPESCALLGGWLGFKDVAHAGVFYGAFHLVDRGEPVFFDHVGFDVRVRLVSETRWPALAAGFDSQGWGPYDGSQRRYERKSPGFYLVASKNWHSFAGDLSLSAGANYTLETRDDDRAPNFFASADWFIAGHVSLLADFDAARNDNADDGIYGEGGVYVDAGVRALLGETVSVMLVFTDLTHNLAPGDESGREVQIVFANTF